MKRMIALCMAMVLSLAVLSGCRAADPNNPYDREPAPKNESAAVVVEQI